MNYVDIPGSGFELHSSSGTESSGTLCAADRGGDCDFHTGDGSLPNGIPVLAVRWTYESVVELLMEKQPNALSYLDRVTHMVYDALFIDGVGRVQDHIGCTLSDPLLYAPILRQLVQRLKPHLKLVWSMPMYTDDGYVLKAIGEDVISFWMSLSRVVTKHEIDVLEMDLHVLMRAFDPAVHPENFHRMCHMPCKFWAVLSNEVPPLPGYEEFLRLMDEAGKLDRLVVKSYGFQRYKHLKTSHGTFRTMMVHPDSALKHFDARVQCVDGSVPRQRILMDIDTCGVEFMRKSYDRESVEKFRLIPLTDIRYRKRFGCEGYEEMYDHVNGCSLLEFHENRVVISYDNAEARRKKLNYVTQENLGGVVLGELTNDASPMHSESLLQEIIAHFMMYDHPPSVLNSRPE